MSTGREATLEEIKAKPFYTAEEAITLILDIVKRGEGEGFCTTEELTAVLDKIASGETISYRGIKAGVLEAINRAGASGVGWAQLYAYMCRGGDKIPMSTLEKAIGELETERRIHKEGGGMAVFKYGEAPETAGQ